MKLLFLSIAFFCLPISAFASSWVFELEASNKYERAEISNLGYALEEIRDNKLTVYGEKEDLIRLKQTGRLLSSREITKLELKDYPGYDEDFHNYEELTSELQRLAGLHNNIMRLGSIGLSLEGRTIHHVVLSENPDETSDKPAIALMGGHHAREHLSVELPLGIIKYFLEKYRDGDTSVKRLLASRVLHIIPMVNPDGAEHDIVDNNYKMWRKNRRVMDGAVGVDLNRNYDFQWGTTGTSNNPRSDVYHGPSPFSEPETRAIKNFIEAHQNISILVSFYTFSELILYPWGHTYDRIPNARDWQVHKTMAETMANWNGYTPKQSSSLYPASGDTTDWSYGVHGIFSFTFELDPKRRWDGGFYPGQSYIEPVIQKNLRPVLYLTELADNPYRALQTESSTYGLSTPLLSIYKTLKNPPE